MQSKKVPAKKVASPRKPGATTRKAVNNEGFKKPAAKKSGGGVGFSKGFVPTPAGFVRALKQVGFNNKPSKKK
jgi:hypothetical protein